MGSQVIHCWPGDHTLRITQLSQFPSGFCLPEDDPPVWPAHSGCLDGLFYSWGPIPSSDHCMGAVNSASLGLPPEMLDEEVEIVMMTAVLMRGA